jgi:predicted bacteriocin transport accessory protein
MTRTLTIVAAALLAFGLAACASTKAGGMKAGVPSDAERADMSAYATYDAGEEYLFAKSNIRDMYNRMNRNETFAIFFGFAKCPWCRDFMPVINEASRKSGWGTIYYANTRENETWKSNLDMDDYDLLVEMAFDYLPYDEEGIKHLDAPTAYFVKNGKIQTAVFAPNYEAHKITIPDDIREQLMEDLLKAFQSIQ